MKSYQKAFKLYNKDNRYLFSFGENDLKVTKKEEQLIHSKKKNYHIIVASLTTLSDANRMLEQYKKQGYSDAVVKENSGRYRISLCNYADKAAAYQKLNDLKKADAF